MSDFNFFMRREGKNFDTEDIHDMTLSLPSTSTISEALTAAWVAGMSRGSQRSGCFQVQSDLGVWEHINEKAIRLSRLDMVTFRTWQQIELDDA